jgi:hypothetical protein
MGTMVCDNESKKKNQPCVLKVEAQSSIIRQYSKNDKVTQKGERTRKGLHARHKKKGDISMKDQSWFIGKQGLIHSLHVRIIHDRIFLFWKPRLLSGRISETSCFATPEQGIGTEYRQKKEGGGQQGIKKPRHGVTSTNRARGINSERKAQTQYARSSKAASRNEGVSI